MFETISQPKIPSPQPGGSVSSPAWNEEAMLTHAALAIVDAADAAGIGLAIIAPQPIVNSASYGAPVFGGSTFPAIRYVNQSALDLGGHSEEDLLGLSIAQFIPTEFWPVLEEYWQAFEGEQLVRTQLELAIVHREGHTIPVSIGLSPAELMGERVVVVFLTDITQRKQAEDVLRLAKEEAEALGHAKSIILSNFTHELRTPLHSILGFSSLLADSVPQGELRDYALSVHTSGRRLLGTLTSVMELAALESRPSDLAMYPTLFADTVAKLAETYRSRIEDRGLALQLDFRHRDQVVLLDHLRFEKLFERIMTNAIKYTHTGGIKVEISEQVRTRPYGLPSEELAVLKIIDTGVGMSPEFVERAFDKFKQEGRGESRGYEGIGIGLPLARGYARQMNGEVTLRSELGMGTEVRLQFPIVSRSSS